MSAALRVPLRALKIDPATDSRPPGILDASSWGRSVSSQGSTVAASRRSFSVKGSPLLYAETESKHKSENGSNVNSLQRSAIKWFFLGSILGLGAVTFSDQVEHAFQAAKRSGRVVGTLAVCINDYRITLKRDASSPEEHNALISACHKRCAERTLRVLEKNGSIFIKLGQHLSSMGYLLPIEWTSTFIPLQDRCPVSSIESIGELFRKDTGQDMNELFSSFESTPIGAASLAQVHIATLKDTGQKVAVKVQHPALDEWVPLDLALTRFTFSMLKRFFPDYDLEWLSKEMDLSLPQELDFRREAQNATHASEYFQKHSDTPLVIPRPK
ncbi:hypothetical protein PDIDSM_4011 [Penicillium digitatum]|nr:hypothetical protein PDIDSM_4011 [Penicillium digitatum]